jgi:hypothetical protein
VLCRLPGIEAEMISVSCKIPPSLYHSIHCGGVLRGVSRDHRRWVKQASASKDQLTDEFADRSTLELSGVPDQKALSAFAYKNFCLSFPSWHLSSLKQA